MELVERQFRQHWPRLYLDSAELIEIGRQRLAESLINEFIAAIDKHAVVLVISHAHFRDMLKPDDRAARDLLASTLERFWIRALVHRGPWDIEPWTGGPTDIELLPWGNVRELLEAPEARANLAEHDVVQTIAHDADVSFRSAQRSMVPASQGRLSNNHDAIVSSVAAILGLGLQPDTAAAVDWCAQVLSCNLTETERQNLLRRAAPAEAAVSAMAPLLHVLTSEERLNLWPHISANSTVAPGTWLSKALAGNRLRNIDRAPTRSDSIDLEHCAYFPYVDIATCDRQAYAAIENRLSEAKGPRTPTVFRNGQLEAVLAHVRTMPTKEQLLAAII